MKKHQVKKFIEIYEKEYGIKLSNPDASILAEKIVELVRFTYKPIKKSSKYDESVV